MIWIKIYLNINVVNCISWWNMLQYESRNSSMKGSASKVLRNCKIIFLVILKEEYTMIKDFFLNPEVITLIEKEYNKKIESNT